MGPVTGILAASHQHRYSDRTQTGSRGMTISQGWAGVCANTYVCGSVHVRVCVGTEMVELRGGGHACSVTKTNCPSAVNVAGLANSKRSDRCGCVKGTINLGGGVLDQKSIV